MHEDKIGNFCKEHPMIELVSVKEESGFITERCAICDMENLEETPSTE